MSALRYGSAHRPDLRSDRANYSYSSGSATRDWSGTGECRNTSASVTCWRARVDHAGCRRDFVSLRYPVCIGHGTSWAESFDCVCAHHRTAGRVRESDIAGQNPDDFRVSVRCCGIARGAGQFHQWRARHCLFMAFFDGAVFLSVSGHRGVADRRFALVFVAWRTCAHLGAVMGVAAVRDIGGDNVGRAQSMGNAQTSVQRAPTSLRNLSRSSRLVRLSATRL